MAPFRASLARVWRTPGLNRFLNSAIGYAPAPVRRFVERERLRIRLRDRIHAVPSRALRELLARGLRELTNRVPSDRFGDYLEFGVYNGTSLLCAFRELQAGGLEHVRLFGFDSFEGLPPAAAVDDEAKWQPGSWRSDLDFTSAVLTAEGIDWSRTTLVPGWFDDTLTPETVRAHGITKASVIMVDCDIYSSAKRALDFCAPLIQDHALVLFDDWHAGNLAARNLGEKRAFDEWLQEWGCFDAQPFGSYTSNAETFLVSRTSHL